MRTRLYKAIPKDGEYFPDGWAKGSLIVRNKTTYCFEDDYNKDPDNTEYLIAYDQMTDWGLPNRHLGVDVIPETICEAVDGLFGYKKEGDKEYKVQLYEGDRVNIKTAQYTFRDYVIKYNEEELRWSAVSQKEKADEKDDTLAGILDEIRLSAKWEYEFIGNIHDHLISRKEK